MNFPERNQSSSKDFVKITAGQTVQGVFRGDPHTFYSHWGSNNGKPQSFVCEGQACARCKEGEKAAFRFRLNFITSENGVAVAKIFEQGWKVYQQLEALNKEFPLEKYKVKITRTGERTDTTYTVMPMNNGQITDQAEETISKIELLNLDPKVTNEPPKEERAPGNFQDFNGEDIPF